MSEAGGEILKLSTNIILEKYIKKIINKGDENGNEMVVKFQLPSGLEIVGLPTKNFYGGHWDLGPTWNYAVMADQPFLKKLKAIGLQYPEILVFPAHRFYYNNQWNGVRLAERAKELITHHIERCAAILEILNSHPKTAEEIAQEHFDVKLLEGFGSMMAANEIISHCELLIASGDVAANGENNYAVTGNTDFKIYIESLRSEY